MTAAWPVTDGNFSLGDLDVEFGGTIQDAQLTWQAYGTLNDARDNVIVYPPRSNHEADDLHYYFGFGLAGSEEPRHRASQSGTLGRNRSIDDEVRSHWRLG